MSQTNNEQLTAQQATNEQLKRFNRSISAVETQQYLQCVLGEKKNSFVNNIVALVSNSESLQKCAPMSIVYACLKATALDLPLDPNIGFAYVIPYKNGKTGKYEAQFQLGYRGLVQLSLRSAKISKLNVTDVREGELRSRDLLTGDVDIRAVENRGALPVVGYAAFFELKDTGLRKVLYMSKEEIEAHAKRYSKTYSSQYKDTRDSSKWTTDFDAMASKTVLKLLLSKWAPLSVEMANAITLDQQVFNEQGEGQYADNPEDQQAIVCTEDRKEALREKIEQGGTTAPTLL